MSTYRTPNTTRRDARTGREVRKVTSWDDAHCVGPYPYCQAFSADERYLVFTSNRTGYWELYRLDIEAGETKAITDYGDWTYPAYHRAYYNFHPNGREVFFDDGATLWAVDI